MLKKISTLTCILSVSILSSGAHAFDFGDLNKALDVTNKVVNMAQDDDNSSSSSSNSSGSSFNTEKRSAGGKTPLMEAASVSDRETMQKLLEAGADPNAQDDQGKTVIHQLSYLGSDHNITPILKFNPDLNIVDNEGYTALMRGAQRGYDNSVRVLIEAGADGTILPPGKTLEEVVQDGAIISMIKNAGKIMPMPKSYSIDATVMKNAKKQAQTIKGNYVDLLFLESSLRPFKSSKWPYPVTHHSMKVGYVEKVGNEYVMKTYDLQVFNSGQNLSDIRIMTPMNKLPAQKIDYK